MSSAIGRSGSGNRSCGGFCLPFGPRRVQSIGSELIGSDCKKPYREIYPEVGVQDSERSRRGDEPMPAEAAAVRFPGGELKRVEQVRNNGTWSSRGRMASGGIRRVDDTVLIRWAAAIGPEARRRGFARALVEHMLTDAVRLLADDEDLVGPEPLADLEPVEGLGRGLQVAGVDCEREVGLREALAAAVDLVERDRRRRCGTRCGSPCRPRRTGGSRRCGCRGSTPPWSARRCRPGSACRS